MEVRAPQRELRAVGRTEAVERLQVLRGEVRPQTLSPGALEDRFEQVFPIGVAQR